jgi:hypothetical protein
MRLPKKIGVSCNHCGFLKYSIFALSIVIILLQVYIGLHYNLAFVYVLFLLTMVLLQSTASRDEE